MSYNLKKFIIISVVILLIFNLTKQTKNINENFNNYKLKIVVSFYNKYDYLEKCLSSIYSQKYKNFDLCLINDFSVEKEINNNLGNLINKYKSKSNFIYIKNTENEGSLKCLIKGINTLNCKNDDIIIWCDGDDYLLHNNVFGKINKTYMNNDIKLTFGNYIRLSTGKPDLKKNINFQNIIKNKSYRNNRWCYSHLKTFKYEIFSKINHKDLKINNKYFKNAVDHAVMYPLLEMSGGKFKFILEPLYVYRDNNNNANHNNKIKYKQQSNNARYIKMLPKYKTIY
jgi:glycosyltransferase involved in cell wall biosynthesis